MPNETAQAAGGRTLKGTPIGEFRHPAVDAYLATHADVLAYVPYNVPDFMAYWTGLSAALQEMANHPGQMGARLTGGYPIAKHMHPFMVQFGGAYPAIAAAAEDVLKGYIMANPADVARHLHPRPNEQWANVGNGSPGGYAQQQIDRLLQAHRTLFLYAPSDPVDLENYYCALPIGFVTMGAHVEDNQTWVARYFPGAANIPVAFYLNWMNTYQTAAAEAYQMLEGYQFLAADDLNRHKNGRVNEERADVV